jgi:hypothetical protein
LSISNPDSSRSVSPLISFNSKADVDSPGETPSTLGTFAARFQHLPNCKSVEGLAYDPVLSPLESGIADSLNFFSNSPVIGNTWVGFANFFSFDAVSVRGAAALDQTFDFGIEKVLLIHRTNVVASLWTEILDSIHKSPTRTEAYEKIISYIDKNRSTLFCHHCDCGRSSCPGDLTSVKLGRLAKQIHMNISWLSTDDRYAVIKKLVDDGNVAVLQADLSLLTTVRRIKKILEDSGSKIDTLYIGSDRDLYEDENKLPNFRKNICTYFMSDNPNLVTTQTRTFSRVVNTPRQFIFKSLKQTTSPFSSFPPKCFFPDSKGCRIALDTSRFIIIDQSELPPEIQEILHQFHTSGEAKIPKKPLSPSNFPTFTFKK